jgi:ArsR family metal-binding transcriptional regulator
VKGLDWKGLTDRFLLALRVHEELEFKMGTHYWYLGPASDNQGYEDKKGWVTYQFYSDDIIYIPSENPKVIMNTKIQGKTLLEHFIEFEGKANNKNESNRFK